MFVKRIKLNNLKKIAVASVFVAGGVLALKVNAQTVNVVVNGTNYTVGETTNLPYTTNVTPYALTTQPWYGNSATAVQFATAVGYSLGTWNGQPVAPNAAGVLFSYAAPNGNTTQIAYWTGAAAQYGGGPSSLQNAIYAYVVGYAPAQSSPLSADTQTSINYLASQLQSTYAIQYSLISNGLTYDCAVFDKNGICISAGAGYTQSMYMPVTVSSAYVTYTAGF